MKIALSGIKRRRDRYYSINTARVRTHYLPWLACFPLVVTEITVNTRPRQKRNARSHTRRFRFIRHKVEAASGANCAALCRSFADVDERVTSEGRVYFSETSKERGKEKGEQAGCSRSPSFHRLILLVSTCCEEGGLIRVRFRPSSIISIQSILQ